MLESTWINNGSRNWAAETINFLCTQPKKEAGDVAPRGRARSREGNASGAEVNNGVTAVGAGRASYALLCERINLKHMLAADTAEAVPCAELGVRRDFGRSGAGPPGRRGALVPFPPCNVTPGYFGR